MIFGNRKTEYAEKFLEKFEGKLNQKLEEKLAPVCQEIRAMGEKVKENGRQTDSLAQNVGRFQAELHKHDMSIEDLMEEWEEKSLNEKEVRNRLQDYKQSENKLLELFEAYQEQFFQMKKFACAKDGVWAEQLELMGKNLARIRQECDISIIEESGIPVNYDLYEVIEVKSTSDPDADNLIADVYRCGYIYKGKIMKKAQAAAYRAAGEADAITQAEAGR